MGIVSTDEGDFTFQTVDEAMKLVQMAAQDKSDLWISGEQPYPCIAVCINGEYAAINFFRNDEGDMWLSYNDKNQKKENYGVRLTSAWFRAHREIPPNRETLPRRTLPIYIFQGTIDANVPVEQAREIAEAFREAGKTNLHLREFEMHDHDLNYILYPISGTISEGLQAIFDTAKEL